MSSRSQRVVGAWRRDGSTLREHMTGRADEIRARAIVGDFIAVEGGRFRVVEYRDKPDAEIEVVNTGQRIGIEVTELLEPTDGEDRSLESVVCGGILDACRKALGESGAVTARIDARPKNWQQIERWLAAFREWPSHRRLDIVARGEVAKS